MTKVWLKEKVVHGLLYPKGIPYKRFTETLLEQGVPYDVIMLTIDKHTKSGFMTARSGRFVLCDIDIDTRWKADTIVKMLSERDHFSPDHADSMRDCIERGLRKIKQELYTEKANE